MLYIYKSHSKYIKLSRKWQGKEIKPFMVDSGLVSQLLNLVRKLHGGKSLCRLVGSLCLVIMTSFPNTSAECSLFQSKTIYFADSLKVTVNRPILSKNRLIPCKMNWYTHVFRSFHNFFKSKESFWNNPNKTIV